MGRRRNPLELNKREKSLQKEKEQFLVTLLNDVNENYPMNSLKAS